MQNFILTNLWPPHNFSYTIAVAEIKYCTGLNGGKQFFLVMMTMYLKKCMLSLEKHFLKMVLHTVKLQLVFFNHRGNPIRKQLSR